jgi:hypothetical protein
LVRQVLITIVLGLAPLSARADEPAPIRVEARVPPKTYYVGQAIELRVGAEAAGERPEIIPPVVPCTDVSLIDTALSPLNASGIGDQTSERNLFITRFRLIPHCAGLLRIPPVRSRLGERSGASPPLAIDVHALPVIGRPAGFLGGVGGFAVEASVSPTTVRTGQDLTYTIHVTGPAARGMTSAPVLDRFSQVPLGLQVEPLPQEAADSPPSRRFRYRIRPTRAGSASLPPVAIAAFDPPTTRYVTKVTSGLPIRVVPVPKFDPATLDYRLPPTQGTPARSSAPGRRPAVFLAVGIVAIVLAGLVAWTVLTRGAPDPRRLLRRRARGLDVRHGPERTARQITDALAEYLERTIGRPRGVLTPVEARSAIAQATQEAEVGERCARLVADCDRTRYSGHEPRTAGLVAEARQLFEEIGRQKKR